ncbi:histidine kinase [Flavicella sp.]|uniref:histidine kinase n=1 Tax=Flavicella sp. TaxID=2957742 RepID=UPI003016A0F3
MNRFLKNVLLACAIGIATSLLGNFFYSDFNFESYNELFYHLGINQLYSFVLTFSNLAFFYGLNRIKWKDRNWPFRVVIGIIGSVTISLSGLFFLRVFTKVYLKEVLFETFMQDEQWRYYSFGLWISLTIVIVFHVFYYYYKYQDKKVTESQIVAKTETAKYESLKNQLDPHFLFNSLNVLTSLIEENPIKAGEFTTGLSKVYRYVLEQKDKNLIPLEEELKFAKSYMQLLKMRFEDGIEYSLPERISNPDYKVVPLSLQLLLENAVKHNIISSKIPLQIKIYEQDSFLVIENNNRPKASLEKSTKVGLENIKQRYALITKKLVEVISDSEVFQVKLPLLTKEIKIMQTDYINQSEKYLRAKKRVDALKGFYYGLASYCVVIPFLAILNYRTDWSLQWFWYPMLGWGLGLSIKGIRLLGFNNTWEQKKVQQFMDSDQF